MGCVDNLFVMANKIFIHKMDGYWFYSSTKKKNNNPTVSGWIAVFVVYQYFCVGCKEK